MIGKGRVLEIRVDHDQDGLSADSGLFRTRQEGEICIPRGFTEN